MGESVEITTWPNHQNVFYKVTSGAFMFEVKAPGNASFGLAKKPGKTCDILIGLGDNQNTWIKRNGANNVRKVAETPYILSIEEFRRFWVRWYGNTIRLGRDTENTPTISYNCCMPDLKYITFSVINNNRNPVYWRFEVPPVLEKPMLKPVVGGDLHWVFVEGDVRFPDDAFIAGFEKENLYIIRANHRGALTPGKFVSSEGVGYVSWGGDANEKVSFQVLCGFDCTWVPTSHDKIPVGAVVGGHSEANNREKLYIGRVKYMGNIIPGKVQPSHKVCYVAYDGKEIAQENYEILTVMKNMHTANKLLIPVDTNFEGYNEDDDNDDNDNDNYDNDNDEEYDDYQPNFDDY